MAPPHADQLITRSSTSTPETTLIVGSKRKLNDDHTDVIRSKASKQSKLALDLDPRLACPFFKNDLAQHQDCVKAAYQTWAHVKQHLRRKHYHKNACRSLYFHAESEAKWHENVGSHHDYTQQETDLPKKIGDAQMRLIEEKTKPRHMTDAARWNAAWGIIFPHTSPPATPYAQDLIVELVDYVIRRISDRPESFDTELVDEKLVTSPAASKAVASRFIELLRDDGDSVKPLRVHPRQEDNADATEPIPTRVSPEVMHNCIPLSASTDDFTCQSPETGGINSIGTANHHELEIEGEESMAQEFLLLDPGLWEGLGRDTLCMDVFEGSGVLTYPATSG